MVQLSLFFMDVLMYFVFAGAAYLIFYVILKKALSHRIIQKKFEKNDRIFDEIKFSISTIIIFTLNFAIVWELQKRGYTRHYDLDFSHFTWQNAGYLVLSAFIMMLMHDTYFYWAHRLMHHPTLYRHVHQVHHRSTNPSPWAAFYFHPLEAFAEFGIIYVIVFTLPYNEIGILLFYAYQMFINVMGHLSIELFPTSYSKNGVLKIHNSITHHNMHHKYFNYNYGLYLNVWDGIMGTVHPKYYETFEEVTSRPTSHKELVAIKLEENID
jgi:sterol desaturase/sphingolipid hydroxylase (fatty acid hydroxylase superfamily)